MLTLNEAAEHFKVSTRRIVTWVQAGELKAVNVSRNPNSRKPNLRFREIDIQDFEESRLTGKHPERKARKSSGLSKDWAARAQKLGLNLK
ncbi:MAG: helix-turn-helix domain-containing protein [Thermoguttaceae bacterium]|nr:helix-turn-helix domain-containing protein [Thermoguttaceae bacterium]